MTRSEQANRRRTREALYRAEPAELAAVADRLLRTFTPGNTDPYLGVELSPKPARGRDFEVNNSTVPPLVRRYLRVFERIAKLAVRGSTGDRTKEAGALLRKWGVWSSLPHKVTLSRSYRMPRDVIDEMILSNLKRPSLATLMFPVLEIKVTRLSDGVSAKIGSPERRTGVPPVAWAELSRRVNANV